MKEFKFRGIRVIYNDWLEQMNRPRYFITGFKGYGLVG